VSALWSLETYVCMVAISGVYNFINVLLQIHIEGQLSVQRVGR